MAASIMAASHRVFVGGLFDSITKDELRNRFQTFGDVTDVTIVHKNDGEGNISKTFGYINIVTTTQKLNKCFAVYGGTKWKGHQLKVQLAKEDFMARLEKERTEPEVVKKKKKKGNCGPTKTYTDILETTSTMKKIVPGTPVEGERNWVIGKYGRPLPIVYVPNVGGKKTVKVDPSKFCHCLKRIPDAGDDDNVDVDKLTWTYDDDEMIIPKKKKKKKRKEDDIDTIETRNSNAETVHNITYAEHDVITNEGTEIETLKKHKKKKRKRETEENIHTPCSGDSVGIVDSDVTEQTLESDVVIPNNNDEDSMNNLNTDSSEKKKKKKKRKLLVPTISAPVDDAVCDVSDQLVRQKKRKDKDEKIEASKQEEEGNKDELLSVETEKESHQTLEVIEQQDNDKVIGALTCDVENNKAKPSRSDRRCEDICIPDMIFDMKDDSINNNKSNERRLSTGIVKQLLSVSKKPTSIISKNDAEPLDQINIQSDIQIVRNDKKNDNRHDDNNEIENLFDFEFEDIGGKSKSFVDTLFNSIEIRENENIDDSEEDSDTEDTKEIIMNTEGDSNNIEFKERKSNSLIVENLEQIVVVENIESSENINKCKIIDQIDTDKQINNTVDHDTQLKKSKNTVCIDNNKQLKKLKILNSNKQEKHALSEEKRKKSLEARNCQILQNKGLVSRALKDVDKSSTNTNRITFSESDDDDEEVCVLTVEDTGSKSLCRDPDDKVLPDTKTSTKTQTQKLFDDTDDEEVNEDDEEIIVKPQFQGKEGEKLFKMQQRFGGDGRFKLDERFAEDNDNTMEEVKDGENVENDDDDDEDLHKEKEMNMSVLEEVLGKPIRNEKKEREFTYQRYDPDSIEHEKFEVKVKPSDKNTKDDDDEIEMKRKVKKKPAVQTLPKVSKDSFYSVDVAIKDLFGKGETASFSFLGNGNENADTLDDDEEEVPQETYHENICEEVTDVQIDTEEEIIKVPSWKKGLEDIRESERTSNEKDVVCIENNKNELDNTMRTYLYIPDDDVRLDIGKRFIRSEGLDEITQQWRAIRGTLTKDYRKKHKDALRRVRRMREKRFNKH